MPTLKDQVLGELQAMYGKPVMDKDGKVIGRIGKDPEEPTISAEERIHQGFIQAAEAKMKDISAVLEKMSDAVLDHGLAHQSPQVGVFLPGQRVVGEPLSQADGFGPVPVATDQ